MTNQEIAEKVNKQFDNQAGDFVLAEDVEAYLEDGYADYLSTAEIKYIDWLIDDGS